MRNKIAQRGTEEADVQLWVFLRWFVDWQEVTREFGHTPGAWQLICQMALFFQGPERSSLPAWIAEAAFPAINLLLPPLSLSFADSTDQSVTTSGTSFLSGVQPGERNRFQTPTSVLKQRQLAPQAPCSAEHRTNCFKTQSEGGRMVWDSGCLLSTLSQSHQD